MTTDEVERLVYEYFRRTGKIIEDVERAEAELEMHPIPLPMSLRDPDAIFERARRLDRDQ